MEERGVWSLGWEDALEEGTETHFSILAWRTPWAEEPGCSPWGRQVGHDWSDLAHKAQWVLEAAGTLQSYCISSLPSKGLVMEYGLGHFSFLWSLMLCDLSWVTLPLWTSLTKCFASSIWYLREGSERLLLNYEKTLGFLASGGEEFSPGPQKRVDCSELLCNKVLLKYKGDRETFWHRHQKGAERVPPASLQLDVT